MVEESDFSCWLVMEIRRLFCILHNMFEFICLEQLILTKKTEEMNVDWLFFGDCEL